MHLKIQGNSTFLIDSNSEELEVHRRTTEKLSLSVLSVKSTILLDCLKKSVLHMTRLCGPHFSTLLSLNTNYEIDKRLYAFILVM